MPSVITIAGEKLFAEKAQQNQQLDIDTFIFANVPGQDPAADIDRNETIPTAHKVHEQNVQQVGRINENVVVYSTVLDSVTGDFDFNWVGLYSSVNQTLVAINHIPNTSKTKTVPGTAGNTLNRNFGIEYSGIAALTGITVAPETWQLDFTARLSGMDDLTRKLAMDLHGKDSFIDDGFKVVPRSTVNTFKVIPGAGYVSGLRVELDAEHILTLTSSPQFVYIDAYFDGDADSVWKPKQTFTVSDQELDDYIDGTGKQHYVYKLAKITAADTVEDLREKFNAQQDSYIRSFETENKAKSDKNLKVGQKIEISERDYAVFDVVEKGSDTENGMDLLATDDDQTKLLKSRLVNGVVNVAWFGAKADNGATDSRVAFQRAIDTGASVFVPKDPAGKYYQVNNLQLQDGQCIFSYDAEIRVVSGFGIKHGNDSKIEGLIIKGNGKDGDASGGVFCSGKFDTKTTNVILADFNGIAYQTDNSVDRHQGNLLSKFVVRDSLIGINNGYRGEYGKATTGTIYGCGTGISISAGNNNFSSVTVTDNDIGVHLKAGQNDSHGVCSGLTINHNNINVQADKINAKAFNFSGCEIYAGDIWLNECEGVTFTGCELSVVEIIEEGARYCHFSSNHFVSQITVAPNANGKPSEVYYHNSNIYNDTSMTRPVFFPEGSYSRATLENNLLGIADGTKTNLLDNNDISALSGNPSFQWQHFFQDSEKAFAGEKKTRVDGTIVHFNAEINVSRDSSFIPDDGSLKVVLESEAKGVMLKAELMRQHSDALRYTNVYKLTGSIKRENDKYRLMLINNTGETVDVFRNQSGHYVIFCEAWGW